MREGFLKHLDAGAGSWAVTAFESEGGEIITGAILLNGAAKYPVIGGIPRLLRGALLERCLAENPTYVRAHGHLFSGARAAQGAGPDPSFSLKMDTVESFGYEWNKFGKMLDVYEQNHRMYFHPYGRGLFEGKLVLDAGCGTGRHVYYAAKYGAEVVAIDLSAAVEVAYRNTREYAASVHVAQADIYDLPFRTEHFDLVESVGVVHHLPDPQGAFDNLVRYVRPSGLLYLYLYTNAGLKPKNRLQAAKISFKEKLLRPYSRRLPYSVLSAWCYAMALAGRIFLNYPYYVLRRLAATRGLAERMSLAMYADYPLYVLQTDLFDWIATPVNRFYERDEVAAFYSGRGFESVEVLDGPGWRAFGRKAASVSKVA